MSGLAKHRRKAAELAFRDVKALRDTIEVLRTENQALQAGEHIRTEAQAREHARVVGASRAATLASEEAFKSAEIALASKRLEQENRLKDQKLLELQNQLKECSSKAKEADRKAAANLAKLRDNFATEARKLQEKLEQTGQTLQAELAAEKEERANIESQLSAEQNHAQRLLMGFGEAQSEAHWKRKFSSLRAEYKELQLERDHYKRLCTCGQRGQ